MITRPVNVGIDPLIVTLRELREERRWTQVAVARRMGVNVSTVSEWERGTISPSYQKLHAWAHVLGHKIVSYVEPLTQ